jgi:hypothetical protein
MSNPPGPNSSDGKSKPWVAVLIAAITSLGTAFGGYGAAWVQYRGPNQPTPSTSTVVAPTRTIAPEDPKLEIKAPSGPVDQCAFIEGKGTSPSSEVVPRVALLPAFCPGCPHQGVRTRIDPDGQVPLHPC